MSQISSAAVVDQAIRSRRSVRAFMRTPVPRETIEDILEVAARAPSGTNIQPWRVVVLAGDRRRQICERVLQAAGHTVHEDRMDFEHYPEEFVEPYLARRRKVGYDLYGILGITRDDKEGMRRQLSRNYTFFDAPVGLMFILDRRLARGSLLDYGMFMQNIMIAARGRGLHTCPQAAWCNFSTLMRRELRLASYEMLLCGMGLGYADPDAPENALETQREPVAGFAEFHGFETAVVPSCSTC